MAPNLTVLFVADLNVYSKGLGRARALQDIAPGPVTISHTAIGGENQGFPPMSLPYKVACKLGRTPDTEGANRRILGAVRRQPPDLLWIEKGVMIRPATLAAVRRAAPTVRIASYSEDDMALAHNRTPDYTAGLALYDVVFTTKAANLCEGELAALGARRVVFVDKAFDPCQHKPIPVTDDDRSVYGADVGFIGTYEEERARSLMFLAQNGVSVRVWGNGWERMTERHSNLNVEGRAVVNTDKELAYTKAICATRINLAFLRKINRDTQTDRSVEIPACGGFMLAEQSADHDRLFVADKEAVFFDGDADMLEKVRYYLAHEDARQAVAAAGRARCLASGYDEPRRFKGMIETALDRQI